MTWRSRHYSVPMSVIHRTSKLHPPKSATQKSKPQHVTSMKLSVPPAILSILLRGSSTTFASAFLGSSSTISGHASIISSSSSSSRNNFIHSVANNLRGGGINNNSINSIISSSSSTSLAMTTDKLRPFNTWTFDKHCESMSWTPASDITLTATHISATDSSSSLAALEQADLIIVGVFAPPKDDDDVNKDEENDEEEEVVPPIVFSGKAKELDESLGGALTELAAENSKAFQNGGSAGKMTPVARIRDGNVTRRFVLLGLGHEESKKKEVDEKREKDDGAAAVAGAGLVTKAASAIASACHDQKKATTCHVLLPLSSPLTTDVSTTLQTFSTEFHSNLYSDNRYRTGKKIEVKAEDVKSVQLFLESDVSSASVDDSTLALSIATGIQIASGISLTRDIVNAPHNVLNSESLAETAKRIALESDGAITCEILGKEECEKRGMGAYLGVARGSETEPQFIHLTYKPASGDIK
jgi:hypothetical protein